MRHRRRTGAQTLDDALVALAIIRAARRTIARSSRSTTEPPTSSTSRCRSSSSTTIPAVLYVATDFVETGRAFPDGGTPLSWARDPRRARARDSVTSVRTRTPTHCSTALHPKPLPRPSSSASIADAVRARRRARRSTSPIRRRCRQAPPSSDVVREPFPSAAVAGTRPNAYGATDPYRLARSPVQRADGMRLVRAQARGRDAPRGRRPPLGEPRPLHRGDVVTSTPRLVHVTTTDISLVLLLGPQLAAFRDAGYEVIGVSAPGPYVERLEALGRPARSAATCDARHGSGPRRRGAGSSSREPLPAAAARHRPHPQPEARCLRPDRRACRARPGDREHGARSLRAADGPRGQRRTVGRTRLERLAAKCSDAELVQNVEDLPVLCGASAIDERKLHLLGNGIDLARFDPERSELDPRRAASAWQWGDRRTPRSCAGSSDGSSRRRATARSFDAARACCSDRAPQRRVRHRRPRSTTTSPTP